MSELRGFYRVVPLYVGDPPRPYTAYEQRIVKEFYNLINPSENGLIYHYAITSGMPVLMEPAK